MIEPHEAHEAGGIQHLERDIAAAGERGDEIRKRLLHPVDLAALEGGRGGRRIGQDVPLDTREMRDLAARSPVRQLRPRYVALELRIGYATSRNELVFQKAVRTRPNNV